MVANRYLDLLFGKENAAPPAADAKTIHRGEVSPTTPFSLNTTTDIFETRAGYNQNEYRWGDGSVAILDYYLEAAGQPYPAVIDSGQMIRLSVVILFHTEMLRPILGLTIKTKEGVTVYGANSETLNCGSFQQMGRAKTVVQVDMEFICRLAPGDYFLSLGVATRQGEKIIPHDRRYDCIHVAVRPHPRFFGLADCDLTLCAKQMTS
jgi:lipopolysaccharide transport system ATP-binding protein